MLKNTSLQTRLTGAFLAIGFIVFIVALLGWGINSRLNNAINTLNTNSLPSVIGLWKINEGQTQIESSERALLDLSLTAEKRKAELTRIKQAWEQINQGFTQYDSAGKIDEEARLYEEIKIRWGEWKKDHETFMQINQEFESIGIFNPPEKELELVALKKETSPEMSSVKRANLALDKLRKQAQDSRPSFEAATKLLLDDIQLNEKYGSETAEASRKEAAIGSFWLLAALILGPTAAGVFGFTFSKQIANNVSQLVNFSNSIAARNASANMLSADSKDEITKLQSSFQTVGTKIAELVEIAQKISNGDLTAQIQPANTQDELGKLQNAFYSMNKDLNSLIRRIQQSGIQITTSSTQISASGKQLEATVAEQLASTNEVAATAQEIAATSRNLVKTMEQVTDLTKLTATAASESHDELQDMEETMRQLTEGTNSITSKLGVMNKKASNINNVVVTITKVADQTSILSLNAAIEAEKAGEYGAGFAVVAREIRRLANQTAVATLEIEQIVKDMQSAVSVGVMEMDKFNNSVKNSVDQVNRISTQIGKVINQVQDLPPQFDRVNQSMEEQSRGAIQISEVMSQLSESSQQTADALRETNGALEQLEEAAQSLRVEISHFHVNA
jgi:methyl-accepting chemotaxis protein WspA